MSDVYDGKLPTSPGYVWRKLTMAIDLFLSGNEGRSNHHGEITTMATAGWWGFMRYEVCDEGEVLNLHRARHDGL
jgi:hypothetical protein